jgi:hypothetical protein
MSDYDKEIKKVEEEINHKSEEIKNSGITELFEKMEGDEDE